MGEVFQSGGSGKPIRISRLGNFAAEVPGKFIDRGICGARSIGSRRVINPMDIFEK